MNLTCQIHLSKVFIRNELKNCIITINNKKVLISHVLILINRLKNSNIIGIRDTDIFLINLNDKMTPLFSRHFIVDVINKYHTSQVTDDILLNYKSGYTNLILTI